MDSPRFDHLARELASARSRRGVVGSLFGLGAGLLGISTVDAACPSGQLSRRGSCVCKKTGRPPVNGVCPCPKGQMDDGDGLGCLACRSAAECPPSDACITFTCAEGVCLRSLTVCPDDDPCQVVVCDPARGCVSSPVPTNEPGRCPAGSVCCADGACTPLGTTEDCTTCGDGCSGSTPSCSPTLGCVACLDPSDCGVSDQCTIYTCEGGVCGSSVTTGAACHNGDPCTVDDRCQADGSCLGTPVVCTPQDQCHTAVCDPTDGRCLQIPLTDTPCDDGDACTQTDTCQAGVCVGRDPVVCAAPDQCHEPGVCNLSTGACEYVAKADGTPCDDGNPCTQTDTCRAGVCAGGNPVVCAPPDQCHEAGVCNAATGECEYQSKADGTACAGADLCLSVYTCQAGACTGSAPVVCPAPDQCHTAGVCNPATGVCSTPAKADSTPCETGNRCTADTCQDGVCVVGPVNVFCPPVTDAQCQIRGVCAPATGICVIGLISGAPCDDGNACTRTDTCVLGVCTGGNPVVCDPPGVCQQPGVCNPMTGTCSHANKSNGSACPGGACCNGSCCPTGKTCCGGVCCASGESCCGGQCCAGSCCGGQCCPTGQTCCFGQCCAAGGTCCNRQCCAAGRHCCGSGDSSGCCDQPCCGGVCCTFDGARCCPGGICKVGVSC